MNNTKELTNIEMEEANGGFDLGAALKFTWNETTKFIKPYFCLHSADEFLWDETVKNNDGFGYLYLRHYRCYKCGGEYCTTENVMSPRD